MPRTSWICSKISQRWLTVSVIFIAFLNMYGMRLCLSITITEMALPHNKTEHFSDDTCSRNSDTNNSRRVHLGRNSIGNRYDWSERTQGLILSSFYWGYILTCIIGGIISQKFGSRRVLGFSTLFASAFTILTPYCTTSTGSTGLIILRLAMGLSEGATHSALNDLLAYWIPRNEPSKAGFIVYSSISIGSIYGILPSGIILQHADWPTVFYCYGTAGIVSFLMVAAFCYNEPKQNPFISDEELSYLNSNLKNMHSKRASPPWRHIFTSRPAWALIFTSLGQTYGMITLMSDVPKYMSNVLQFPIQSNGLMSSIPYLAMWITGSIFSWLADKLITTKILSITVTRKIYSATATYGLAVSLVAAAYVGCDGFLVTALLALGFACYSAIFSSTAVNPLDLSPNYAAVITGLMNGLSTIMGMLAPYVVGVVTTSQTMSEWRTAFWIVCAVMLLSNSLFLMFGSGDVQEWNDPGYLGDGNVVRKSEVKEEVDLLHNGE